MTDSGRSTKIFQFGEWFGRWYRNYSQAEKRVGAWLQKKGAPSALVICLKGIVLFVILIAVLCFTLSALAIAILIFLVTNRFDSAKASVDSPFDEDYNYKKSVFYDPINYNDSDDPRFDD